MYTAASFFMEEAAFTLQIGVHFLFGIFGVVGLYGFVYEKPLIAKIFWAVFAPLFVGWSVFIQVGLIPLYPEHALTSEETMLRVVWLIFYVPQFYALLSYSYKNGRPWGVLHAT